MSDSKTATTNGSPCPLPHENRKPRSITTSGDEHKQEWGSHKLCLDGHTSLPHTNSREGPPNPSIDLKVEMCPPSTQITRSCPPSMQIPGLCSPRTLKTGLCIPSTLIQGLRPPSTIIPGTRPPSTKIPGLCPPSTIISGLPAQGRQDARQSPRTSIDQLPYWSNIHKVTTPKSTTPASRNDDGGKTPNTKQVHEALGSNPGNVHHKGTPATYQSSKRPLPARLQSDEDQGITITEMPPASYGDESSRLSTSLLADHSDPDSHDLHFCGSLVSSTHFA